MSLKSISVSIALCAVVALNATAQIESSGNLAPLRAGENVVAGSAFNDSPGSSDMTFIVQLVINGEVVFDEHDPIKAIQPLENIPNDANPTGWTEFGFDDSSWVDGENGVGYGDGDDNTVIGDGDNAAAYLRGRFNVSDPGAVSSITVNVDYDDGCVVWINGVEVLRTSGTDIASPATFDSWTDQGSGQSHEASKTDPPTWESLDIPVTLATAVEPNGKTATTWGDLKRAR